ncbi:MAG: tRNA (N6-threonylcarbamoyladenosine(37)-N6)-methyltransferase TrmO [Clostridia bacterium]|nr:tRNA (N6-threonylcarbamoyladenosine(37)-N6)-methyltransferase TrmO [Clostridia bacterium]
MKIIAHIHNDFPTSFGLPRQSGLSDTLLSTIVFEPEYRIKEAFRGLEDYSHLWLLWEFSDAKQEDWSPTVRPPRLGGNTRMGVFATRSPYRPNPIGLSSVKLESIEYTKEYGPVLLVSGADMHDSTPLYDIKPYLPYTDSHPEALGGFSTDVFGKKLTVQCDNTLLSSFSEEQKKTLLSVLEQDPRPSYQNDPERIYGFSFAGHEIHFKVKDTHLQVTGVD